MPPRKVVTATNEAKMKAEAEAKVKAEEEAAAKEMEEKRTKDIEGKKKFIADYMASQEKDAELLSLIIDFYEVYPNEKPDDVARAINGIDNRVWLGDDCRSAKKIYERVWRWRDPTGQPNPFKQPVVASKKKDQGDEGKPTNDEPMIEEDEEKPVKDQPKAKTILKKRGA